MEPHHHQCYCYRTTHPAAPPSVLLLSYIPPSWTTISAIATVQPTQLHHHQCYCYRTSHPAEPPSVLLLPYNPPSCTTTSGIAIVHPNQLHHHCSAIYIYIAAGFTIIMRTWQLLSSSAVGSSNFHRWYTSTRQLETIIWIYGN